MPFNGSGVFQRVRNWVADATAGIKIRADYHDAEDDGFAAGLTNCITKDGQTLVTQNIPFNSKRVTGLADPVNAQDAATKAYTDTKVAAPGVLTGDMTIKNASPSLTLNAGVGGGANLSGLKGDKQRWLMRLGNDQAETGSNVGSNFDLHRYADDGSYLGQVVNIARSDGSWSVNGSVSFTSNPVAAGGAVHIRGWAGDPNQSVIYLTADNSKYLHQTGARLHFIGGPISAGEPAIGSDLATVNYVNGRTAFTPVQQGGGSGMFDNKIYIGWNNSRLIAQVDGVPLGAFVFGGGGFITNVRLADAGWIGSVVPGAGVSYEPHPGAALTGWSWMMGSGGNPLITSFRTRWVQYFTDNWYTVGTG